MKNQTVITNGAEETERFAEGLVSHVSPGMVIGLSGDLGSGKTTFVRGLASGLGIKDSRLVSSPTYVFIQEYPCENTTLYHMDLYRLSDPSEASSLGLADYFRKDAISVIEWPERASDFLPSNLIKITLERLSETTRQIQIL